MTLEVQPPVFPVLRIWWGLISFWRFQHTVNKQWCSSSLSYQRLGKAMSSGSAPMLGILSSTAFLPGQHHCAAPACFMDIPVDIPMLLHWHSFPSSYDPDINISERILLNCGRIFKCLICSKTQILLQNISSYGVLCLIQSYTLYLGERCRIIDPCKKLMDTLMYSPYLLSTDNHGPTSHVGMEKCLTQYFS